ncbi:type I secretion system permease/ATPase [Roseibium sp. Sym1]|uniref:type I secretion system permease/ATPase n=1 Tax=Roseibium sp. Sym1 TaxID=3016006 RepID=UPI0022B32B6E|nr:type I secretion system permease/ATPase [Roseibium sp. Sym1]
MKTQMHGNPQLTATRRAMRSNLVAVGVFSGVINLLMLTGPLFMLQVYDRVLASQSVDTLVALAVLAAGLYFFMGIIDAVRTRVLVSIGHRFEQRLAGEAFSSVLAAPVPGRAPLNSSAIRDVEQIRSFLSSQGAAALFDLPWMPVYMGLVFALHFWLGIVGIAGAVVLVAVALVTDFLVRRATAAQAEHAGRRARLAEASRRNSELVRAMGMRGHMTGVWERVNDQFLGTSARAAFTVGLSSSLTKVFRLALQSTILAVAAYLAIHQEVSPGAMVAASVIISRGLQPIETMVGSWRAIVSAQRSWKNLKETLSVQPKAKQLDLPAAEKSLSVESLGIVPPGASAPTVKSVSFDLSAGEALAVIGPTGCGKSTLARVLVSAWPAARGGVRLDGVPMDQFKPEDLGRQVGFLPQDVELFDGTVAENIARFDPDAKDEDVIAAAKAAGVHELIANRPDGYAASVGERGAALSGGQRQRIALARALYGNPFLVVLDEPNSNLDAAGEAALNKAVLSARERGAIVVVIAHRPSVLSAVDKVLVMNAGEAADFGPRDEVMQRLNHRNQASAQPAGPAPVAPDPSALVSNGAAVPQAAGAPQTVAQGIRVVRGGFQQPLQQSASTATAATAG